MPRDQVPKDNAETENRSSGPVPRAGAGRAVSTAPRGSDGGTGARTNGAGPIAGSDTVSGNGSGPAPTNDGGGDGADTGVAAGEPSGAQPEPGDASSASRQPGWVRRLIQYSRRHPRTLYIAVGSSLVGMAMMGLIPLITKVIIDDVIVAEEGGLAFWITLLIVAALAIYGMTFLRRYFGGRLGLDVQHDLRTDMFRSVIRLDGRRQDQLSTGQVVGRATSDLQLVQGLLFMLPMSLGNIILFVVALVVMLTLSPVLTLIALAVAPALWYVTHRARIRLFPATWVAQGEAGAVAGVVEGAVSGVRVVKGFGQEDQESGKLRSSARRLFATRVRGIRLNSRYLPALQTIPSLGQVAMLAVGGWFATRGEISLGTFVAFSTYLTMLIGPVRMLAALLSLGQQARAGAERIFELIDTEPEIWESPDARELAADAPATVELTDVTFGFAGHPALRGLSLQIHEGETLAVVGTSGSGKSTLVQLLPRYYDAESGTVRIGGHDVRELTYDSLRAAIGLVPENSFLFSGTVRENLLYGAPDATEEQVRAAARAAQADGFITDLEDGYDTVIGELGLTLSGGQRQRLALARAILADPRLLILDDATSAVDARVESEIHEALAGVMAGRTTLLIAHRRSTLQLADRVAVLDGGCLVDSGTHEELQQRCSLYRQLLASPEELGSAEPDPAGLEPAFADSAAGAGAPTEAAAVAEQATAEAATAEDATEVRTSAGAGGVTPELWVRPETDGAGADRGGSGAAAGATSATAGFSAAADSSTATPELLARVEELPPATDTPEVDEARAAQPEDSFGLRRLLRGLGRPMLFGLLLVIVDALAGIALPILIRHGIDEGVTQAALDAVWWAAGVALVVVLIQWVAQYGGIQVVGRTGERAMYSLRVKIFSQLQRLGLDYYERQLGGQVMTRMTSDVDALATFMQAGLVQALVAIMTFLGILVALLFIDLQLAAVVLICLVPLLIGTYYFRRGAAKAYELARERIAGVNAELQESVSGLRMVQAFRRESTTVAEYSRRSAGYRSARVRGQLLISIYFPFVQLLATVATAGVLLLGADRVAAGTLTAGALVAYILYIELFFAPVQQLSQVFDGYQQAVVALGRIQQLLREPTSTPEAEHPRPVAQLRGELEFRAVQFRYRTEDGEAPETALAGIDLHIPAGQTVAFVGETGAGKSTLVKLVARYYDPTEGAVLADGTDLRDMGMSAYRQRLGVVPQEPYLFAGTVRDAVAYGRPDATDAEVEAAARAVGAHAMIATLPDGYLHEVAERGRNLSAGQRQLIALARAELVGPDILLLDEATAALDLATESLVNEATDRLAVRRTTLVVAHRLTTAARADRVVVLDHGRIVEDGTHEELLAQDGRYAQLWRSYVGAPA